jgi:phosphoglycolate phosphatase-like HAD superfamily hydrolase
VLIGDKPWDLAAARHYGFGFVGVASSSRKRLRAAGAERVFDDWRQTVRVVAALEEAAVAAR